MQFTTSKLIIQYYSLCIQCPIKKTWALCHVLRILHRLYPWQSSIMHSIPFALHVHHSSSSTHILLDDNESIHLLRGVRQHTLLQLQVTHNMPLTKNTTGGHYLSHQPIQFQSTIITWTRQQASLHHSTWSLQTRRGENLSLILARGNPLTNLPHEPPWASLRQAACIVWPSAYIYKYESTE